MRYLLLIYTPEVDPSTASPADQQAEFEAYDKFTNDIKASGAYLAGEALEPTNTATSVRVRDGQVQSTDGPFAETKEALGGYYLVEAKDLDAAISWAAKIPGAKQGTIEVRPIWELPAGAGELQTAGAGAAS